MTTWYRCDCCWYAAPTGEFRWGRGRDKSEHPDHRYCPQCGRSVTWFGYTVVSPPVANVPRLAGVAVS